MTAFSLRARLHLSVSSNRALSLPQSRLCIFWARQLPPQREPRRLPPQGTDLILLSKFGVNAIPCRGYNPSVSFADSSPYTGEPRFALHLHQCGTREPRRLPPHATELQRCEPRLSPPTAGCPHPSRRSAKAQLRATFPKGTARAAPAARHRFGAVRKVSRHV